jgi:hypothetical protein
VKGQEVKTVSTNWALIAVMAALAAIVALSACGDDDDDDEAAVQSAVAMGEMDHQAMADQTAEAEFHDAMRKLWEDHVTWTRLAIISIVDGLPDMEVTVDRLLQNQVDIGDAIKPFYGDQAGNQLTELLNEHILVAADILAAAKSADQSAVADASERWYANSDEIAAFLNAANPELWQLDEMTSMMREHLDLTLEEATARLTGDYAADVAAYDKIHQQILEMADMLSDGITAQFPDRF